MLSMNRRWSCGVAELRGGGVCGEEIGDDGEGGFVTKVSPTSFAYRRFGLRELKEENEVVGEEIVEKGGLSGTAV